jgi:hypothetical protein
MIGNGKKAGALALVASASSVVGGNGKRAFSFQLKDAGNPTGKA